MTQLLFHAESYLKEFEANVTNAVDGGVVLDQTAFYTGGGGQPTDSGTLSSGGIDYQVSSIKRVDGNLVHQISGGLPAVGSTVTGYLHLLPPTW